MVYDLLDDALLLRVRLMPSSSSCRINGVFTDAESVDFLKICVISVPEKGKANKELISFLAKKTGIAKSQMEIIGGEFDRYKKIKISGSVENTEQKIKELVAEGLK